MNDDLRTPGNADLKYERILCESVRFLLDRSVGGSNAVLATYIRLELLPQLPALGAGYTFLLDIAERLEERRLPSP